MTTFAHRKRRLGSEILHLLLFRLPITYVLNPQGVGGEKSGRP